MMMLADFLNSDDTIFKNFRCEEDPNRGAQSSQPHAMKRQFTTTSDSSSEEQPPAKKLRRSTNRRIKCRARGLSNSHKSENAYLEIPPDAPHGLLLSCSDLECAGSGRRFRFCQGTKIDPNRVRMQERQSHIFLLIPK